VKVLHIIDNRAAERDQRIVIAMHKRDEKIAGFFGWFVGRRCVERGMMRIWWRKRSVEG
jgi:hypothetical protein